MQIDNTDGLIEEGKTKAKKTRDMVLTGLGIPSPQRTVNGWPAVSSTVLQTLAGKPEGWCPASACVRVPGRAPPHVRL